MANFAILVDADRERRQRYVDWLLPRLAPITGLVAGSCRTGCFEAAWEAAPTAPVDVAADAAGAAVVWGDVIDGGGDADGSTRVASTPGGVRLDAAGVRQIRLGAKGTQAWDGFHANVVYSAGAPERIWVGADILGLFPVCYYATADLIIIASSAASLAGHDAFRAQLDVEGLAGILLTGGTLEGLTLWQGVRRLSPGHVLQWERGRGATEVEAWRLPDDASAGAPADEVGFAELVSDRLRAWAGTLPPERAHTLLLSGGRDSRLVAGALAAAGVRPHLLTLGLADDAEAICATQVARKLGWQHSVADPGSGMLAAFMDRAVAVEHLQGHVAGCYVWGTCDALREHRAAGVVSGHILELIIGGVHLGATAAAQADDVFHAGAFRHGIPPEQLRALFRRDVAPVAGDVAARARAVFDGYSDSTEARLLRFRLHNRTRHHAGVAPWRMAFAAWPALPVLDRRVASLAALLPAAAVTGRRLQDTVLRRHYRALAMQPFEEGPALRGPLVRSWAQRLRDAAVARGRRSAAPSPGWYYGRLYDLDSPGWREVRRAAAAVRDGASHVLDPAALERYVPAAEEPWPLADPIVDSFGRKMLLGFLLWNGMSAHATR